MLSPQEELPALARRLKESMTAAGVSNTELANRIGVSVQGVGFWLKTGKISRERLPDIARALRTTVDWLLGHDSIAEPPTDYGRIDGNITHAPAGRSNVPLISWVQAGELSEAVDIYSPGQADEWLPCPSGHGQNTFALRVVGDSMTSPYPGQRSYPEGTIIYVDPDVPAISGKRVIAKLNDSNEVTFKTYVEDAGRRYLKPLNPQYPVIELHNGLEIIGVVIASYFPE